jgi:acetyl esterase/lipase
MPKEIYDPQLAAILPALKGMVPVGMTEADLPRFRTMSSPAKEDIVGDHPIDCLDCLIPGYQNHEIAASVFRRRDHVKRGPGIYFLHGGGMVMGNRFAGAHPLIDWCLKHDAVCVTVEYRLAPECPAPIPVEDCYAGLLWMASKSFELNFDPDRLVIFGGSGGGGLAAGTTLIARDRNGPKLMGQLLQCPMIDDRNKTASARQYDGVGVWDTTSNWTAWKAVLGNRFGGDRVSPYVAPSRATDLGGLPPTFIDVGACEVFRDEAIDYAMRILASGGQCELHVWSGAFHGFYDIAPQAEVSKSCLAARDAWLERLLAEG